MYSTLYRYRLVTVYCIVQYIHGALRSSCTHLMVHVILGYGSTQHLYSPDCVGYIRVGFYAAAVLT
jgi:hypothetical protein